MLQLILFMTGWVASGEAENVITLAPGHPLLAAAALEPYQAVYHYHRPDAEERVRVDWRLQSLPDPGGSPRFRTTLVTYSGREKQYFDINEFDAGTMAHRLLSVPTMTPDGLADIHLQIDGIHVHGRTAPRNGADATIIDRQIDTPVIGGGWDLVLAALPLDYGMEIRWPSLNPDSDRADWVRASVDARADISVAGRDYSAWVVDVDDGMGRFWIIHEPPYVLRREFRQQGELFLIWELESYATDKTPGDP